MRTWKQNIPEAKYQRVKRDPASRQVTKNGSQISRGFLVSSGEVIYGHILGDFIYVAERSDTNGWEFFKYRIKSVAAYTVDYGYYEHRLQKEERV